MHGMRIRSQVNSVLRVLHLDNNRIGDRTAFALAKSLKAHAPAP